MQCMCTLHDFSVVLYASCIPQLEVFASAKSQIRNPVYILGILFIYICLSVRLSVHPSIQRESKKEGERALSELISKGSKQLPSLSNCISFFTSVFFQPSSDTRSESDWGEKCPKQEDVAR